MSSVVGSLRVMLGMDSAAFQKGLTNAQRKLAGFQKSMKKTSRNLQRAGRSMSVGVTAPLTALAYKSIDAQKQQEQAIAAVTAALNSMGDGAGYTLKQLEAMASKMQTKSLYGDEAILQKVTANLLTFGNVQGEVFERAQQMSIDLSARLGQDLQSSAVMLGKALNDPVKGLTALSRVGVSFTEEQKDQIKAMAKVGNVAGAQALILGELERQYAGQAEALASTDSGRITQAMNAIGDVSERVGAIILPILADIAGHVQAWAEKFSALAPETQKFIVIAGSLAAALGPVLVGLGLVASALAPLAGVIAAVVSPLGLLAVAAVAAGYAIYHNWDKIKEHVGAAVEAVKGYIADLAERFPGVTAAVVLMKDAAARHFKALGGIAKAVFEGDFKGALDIAVRYVSDLSARIVAALKQVGADLWNSAKQIGADIIAGVKAGLEEKWQELKDKISGIATSMIDVFKWNIKSNSPSKVFMKSGNDVVDGLVIGLDQRAAKVKDAMARMSDLVKGNFSGSLGDQVGEVDGAASGIGNTFSKLGRELGDIITKTRTWGDVLRDAASSWSESLRKTALNGLTSKITGGNTGGFLGGLVSSVLGNVSFFAKGGVVGGATAFAMPGGTGVMGEAGPEAIMPLKRSADGSLGVRAQSSPVRIIVEASEDLRVTAAQAGRAASVQVVQANNRAVAQGQRRS